MLESVINTTLTGDYELIDLSQSGTVGYSSFTMHMRDDSSFLVKINEDDTDFYTFLGGQSLVVTFDRDRKVRDNFWVSGTGVLEILLMNNE